jgi:hypothetical protein
MFGRAKVLLTIASSALAMPVVAQAPTAAFDGKYVGASVEPLRPGGNTLGAYAGAKCYPPAIPDPLTIKDGVISGSWEGTVTPQGGVVARDGTGRRINGQMQSDGTMRALYSGAVCSYNFIWRKQS